MSQNEVPWTTFRSLSSLIFFPCAPPRSDGRRQLAKVSQLGLRPDRCDDRLLSCRPCVVLLTHFAVELPGPTQLYAAVGHRIQVGASENVLAHHGHCPLSFTLTFIILRLPLDLERQLVNSPMSVNYAARAAAEWYTRKLENDIDGFSLAAACI